MRHRITLQRSKIKAKRLQYHEYAFLRKLRHFQNHYINNKCQFIDVTTPCSAIEGCVHNSEHTYPIISGLAISFRCSHSFRLIKGEMSLLEAHAHSQCHYYCYVSFFIAAGNIFERDCRTCQFMHAHDKLRNG